MANTVGGLVVTLGLDAAEYTRGLTKAEQQAKTFAANTRTAILEVGKVLTALEIGKTAFDSAKAIIAEASALDALSAATDSSVESLSKLNNQVRLAGGDIATLENALLSLAAGMADANVKGTKTGQALKLLGVEAKDPAQAMQQVVIALDKYADGAQKVALINALFGRSNAAFVATLKDMAASQDVAATVTAKQAREAAELEKAMRTLGSESTKFADLVLTSVVPAITRMIKEFNEGIKIAGGFFAALNRFSGAPATSSIEETEKAIASLDRAIASARANAAHPILGPLQIGSASAIAGFEEQKRLLSFRLAQQQQASDALRRQQDRGFTGKPTAPGLPGAGDRARQLREATDEGLRYQQSLEKQLQATLELSAEEEARVVIFDALRKGQAGFTDAVQATILDMARQLDTTKALKKEEEARKKAAEEAARAEERIAHATNQAIKSALQEVESIKAGNEQLREQIAFLRGGQEAVDRMAAAKLADAIASKEAELAALEFLKANELLTDAIAEQIRQLRERQVLVADRKAAQEAAEEAKKAKQFADDLGNALAQGAENAILHFNNLRDVLKNLEQDLLRIITRKLITQPLGDFLSKGIGSVLGAGAFPGFAAGGVSPGGWATVGELGPEVVHLPRGAQVIPNDVIAGKRAARNVVVNINVPAGATRSTIDQTRLQFGLELQRVLDRNG